MKTNPYRSPRPEPKPERDCVLLKTSLATFGAYLLIAFLPVILVFLGFLMNAIGF